MTEKDFSTLELIKLYWRKKFFIGAVTFVMTSLSIVGALMLPKYYIAGATIMANDESGGMMAGLAGMASQLGFGGVVGGVGDQVNRYLAILKSSTLKEKVIRTFDLAEKYESKTMVDAFAEFSGNYSVILDEEMQVSFSFVDRDQEMVAEIANYILFCLDSINQSLTNSSGRNQRIFVERQYETILDSLSMLEKSLVELMEKNNLIVIPDQFAASAQQAAVIKSNIMLKEVERDVMLQSMDRDAPQVRQVLTEIGSLEEKYAEFYRSTEDGLFVNFNDAPKLGVEYEKLNRKIEYYAQIMMFVGSQLEEAKIEEVKDIPSFQVLDRPMRPDKKYKPSRSKIVIAVFLMSISMSMAYLYFRQRWVLEEN